ncbi:hypothetical protein GMOD_00002062 [Pyrenophora seminiperda CCB06]|uniref:Uncharacterized protein n=1 Tax=Pyrenophora seminiperda CCB06 TaxID=1302712 RepID=A0A3M7LX28_9PLEO|nr:hypothetical protein GMOD_00002062 [Pyrenophora seminiperda CCB06]
MLKPLVLRRNFSLFSRVPYSRLVNLAARNGHASIAIHRVRIRKPFFRISRLVGAFVIATTIYAAAQAVGLKVEVKEIEAKDKQPSPSARPGEDGWTTVGQVMDGEDGNDEDDEEVLLFLPTGFSRPQQKTFYKGTDPEWQEFRKLATDGPRAAKIRGKLELLLL